MAGLRSKHAAVANAPAMVGASFMNVAAKIVGELTYAVNQHAVSGKVASGYFRAGVGIGETG